MICFCFSELVTTVAGENGPGCMDGSARVAEFDYIGEITIANNIMYILDNDVSSSRVCKFPLV